MSSFAPNTNLDDARRLRAVALLLMAVFMFVTFGLLAAGVDDHRLLTRVDYEAKEGLHEHAQAHPTLLLSLARVTDLGRNQYLVVGSIAVITVLAVFRCWKLAAIWAVTTL